MSPVGGRREVVLWMGGGGAPGSRWFVRRQEVVVGTTLGARIPSEETSAPTSVSIHTPAVH